MRILLFEDNEKSIEVALEQLKNHQVTVVRTCFEIIGFANKLSDFDLILTDMNIMIGDFGRFNDKYSPTSQFPAGLVILLSAIEKEVPCVMLTDANGHQDFLGHMLEVFFGDIFRKSPIPFIMTRPEWKDAPSGGKGKDWMETIESAALFAKRQGRKFPDLP